MQERDERRSRAGARLVLFQSRHVVTAPAVLAQPLRAAARATAHAVVSRGSASTQEGKYGDDSTVVGRGFADVELAEDVADVSLESLRAEEELLADALVGVALCHESEHLPLTG